MGAWQAKLEAVGMGATGRRFAQVQTQLVTVTSVSMWGHGISAACTIHHKLCPIYKMQILFNRIASHQQNIQGCSTHAVLKRQDLPCTYLGHTD